MLRELPDGGRLSDAVYANHGDDALLPLELIVAFVCPHQLIEIILQDLPDILRQIAALPLRLPAHRIDDPKRRVGSDIAHDHRILQLLIEAVVRDLTGRKDIVQ